LESAYGKIDSRTFERLVGNARQALRGSGSKISTGGGTDSEQAETLGQWLKQKFGGGNE